ncbi:MAG: hypothetical protein V3V09_10295 [Arenicellales bacterium]
MFSTNAPHKASLDSFTLNGKMMRYSLFAPRLYNFCLSLGFTPGKIMPSRAFCSDESQGFPTILLAKHFGAFPFNHGRVGGIVATGRHGPHAHHGKDLLIVQASHVGYDPETENFGEYRRFQTQGEHKSTSCGKITATLQWYEQEHALATQSIFLTLDNDTHYLTIDKDLLKTDKAEGLFLNLDKLVGEAARPDQSFSTAYRFKASKAFCQNIDASAWQANQRIAIGTHLKPDYFYFKRNINEDTEGHSHLEHNLIAAMPWILCADHPALAAAKINTQVEFDRTYRSIVREPSYQGKNLLFMAGLHIDISPKEKQLFPLTKFIPWAAYHQTEQGQKNMIEQAELTRLLRAQSTDNPDKIDLEIEINAMEALQEVKIKP